MVVMVMDGQGGGVGSAVIKALRTAVKADVEILAFPEQEICKLHGDLRTLDIRQLRAELDGTGLR